ncbi:membrane protein [Corynebacterium atypicum]|uniref:Membrane protein n=1 Tax=Corynebacterium atypicum TaxID=191610 RepID=A0ABN4DB95_9CORY|nr:hypothetical protein [Corynebacterium atypicum]AIG63392.1 membrane protein [Corynebacterium atypicum]
MGIADGILRAATGAFILNSGWGKKDLPVEAAEGLRDFASTGVPVFKEMDPEIFGKFICGSELGIGSALLCPLVPNRLAGAALATFGAGMLTMYFGNDNMTEDDGIRPSDDGIAMAKDSWLAAIGLALVFWPKGKKAEKKAKKG